MVFFTVNTGSSSVRLAAFEVQAGGRERLALRHEPPGDPAPTLRALAAQACVTPDAVVHRFVHGGPSLGATCIVDENVARELAATAALAPLHLPRALAWLSSARELFPGARQIGAFDTAFFRDLPPVATTYALPLQLVRAHGLRRYGYHGLAHHAMWQALLRERPDLAFAGRAITFQLGAGCSAAAITGGRPVDTSMGFTPLEGLVMATRSGDVDPGLLLHLLSPAGGGLAPAELERLLNQESGLRGLAGDPDLRNLMARSDDDARLAIDVYCRRAKKALGAYLAVLDGADAIVFGGGAGEHQPEVRARICGGMSFCGIALDAVANTAAVDGQPRRISGPRSRIDVWVLPVDEENLLADEAQTLLEKLDD